MLGIHALLMFLKINCFINHQRNNDKLSSMINNNKVMYQ